jgi:hypothetical protein
LEAELRNGYHVLHFVGHGAYSERTGTAALLMANESNQAAPARDEDIVSMLARQLANADVNRDDKLRLVFLASCQSATRSTTDSFRGLAPKLVAAGVPAVLAMQEKVPIVTAQAFAATFYQQLLSHGHVDLASNEARSAVLTAKLPGAAIPVLFSRLRSGQLLGQRGRITGTSEQLFWPFLLKMIDRGLCVPFLGPGVTANILPSRESIAQRLATEYNYPLADSRDLPRVAQFVGLMSADLLRSDYFRFIAEGLLAHLGVELTGKERRRLQSAGPSEVAITYDWADRVLQIQESEIHHLLADMELPLYITTNADSFMYEALKHKELNPRRIGPRWQVQAGTPQWSLTPPPSMSNPVVLHLNGYDGDPEQSQNLILGEDEFMAHLVRLYGEQESILPTNVLGMLSQSSYLFLGYQLDDWEFRAILHGLIKRIAETNRENKVHVGVQLELAQGDNPDTAMEYLSRYMGRFNINIYWGSAQQFVTELHTLWQRYLSGESPT